VVGGRGREKKAKGRKDEYPEQAVSKGYQREALRGRGGGGGGGEAKQRGVRSGEVSREGEGGVRGGERKRGLWKMEGGGERVESVAHTCLSK